MAKLGGGKLGAGRKLASSRFPKSERLGKPKKFSEKKDLVEAGSVKKGSFFLHDGQLSRVEGHSEDKVIVGRGGFVMKSALVKSLSMAEAITTKANLDRQ